MSLAERLEGGFRIEEPRFHGVDEPELQGLLKRVLRPGDWAIDGGANCGLFTIPMAKLVGPDGRVLAFEPGENNLARLEENIRLARCRNVEVIPKPLWSSSEQVCLHMHADGSKNSLASHEGTHGAATIEATTLDAYVDSDLRRKLRLIKLDIEGAEHEALKGAASLLNFCPYVVCEANCEALPKFGSSIEALCKFMHGCLYETFILHPTDRLPTYVPPGIEIFPYNAEHNMMKANFNLLFTSMRGIKDAWPRAVCG